MGPILLYDAGCRTCRVFARLVTGMAVHGRLQRVPLRTPLTARLLQAVPMPVRDRSFHLITDDGAIHSAGGAVVVLLGLFPAGSLLRLLLHRMRPLQGCIEWLYQVLATRNLRAACGLAPLRCAAPPGPGR